MSDHDGGPAFPRAAFDVNDYCCDGSPGMSLRDWFAGQALVALAEAWVNEGITPDGCARGVYRIADAMLKERSQP